MARDSSSRAADIAPNYQESAAFLRWAHPKGPWVLVAIALDRKGLEAMTFHPGQEDRVRAWLENVGHTHNVYWTVNPVTRDLATKPARTDIREMAWLHVDVDPRKDKDLDEERKIIRERLESFEPRPSCIIFSGGGYQAFWRLAEPVEINGKAELFEEAKRYNLQLELLLGGDACHNVDRVMRLPGTVNRPDEKKRAKGRTEVLAEVVYQEDTAYDLQLFTPAPQVQGAEAGFTSNTVQVSGNVNRVEDLMGDPRLRGVSDTCKRVIAQGVDPDEPDKWESRSEPLFWVCCELVRAGVDDDTIYAIITDPVWNISASVVDKGSNVQSYAIRQIERAHEEAVDPWLRELNERYAVVVVGGKTRILTEQTERIGGQDRSRLHYMSFGDFENFYRNKFYSYIGGKDGKTPIDIPVGKWWLNHSLRREYLDVRFAPGMEVPHGIYNLWQGFAVEAQPGDCFLYLDHVRDNICRGDQEIYEYLLNWMAAAVQRPGEQGHVAIVLRGRQGTGKGVFANTFGRLWGRHYVRLANSKHLLGNFNAHMEDCVVLFVDEAFWAGDKRGKGVLKSLVTEEDIMIERKGFDAEIAPSHLHIIMASNEEWVVPAEHDDRRYLVLDVGDQKMQDKTYFKALVEQMEAGGREAFLHMLMQRDISEFDARDRPETPALQEQKEHTLEPVEEWILTLLENGVLPNNVNDRPDRAYCSDTVEGWRDGLYPSAREAVPMLRQASIRDLGLELTAWGVGKSGGGRRWRQFRPLAEMRRAWEAKYGPREWPGGREAEWQRCNEDMPCDEDRKF